MEVAALRVVEVAPAANVDVREVCSTRGGASDVGSTSDVGAKGAVDLRVGMRVVLALIIVELSATRDVLTGNVGVEEKS